MTDNRPSEKHRRPSEKHRSQGNLGQKVAEEEKTSHDKIEHMGDDTSRQSDKPKERKEQTKSR